MSMESANAFIERMKTDEEFAKQVVECKDNEARMAFAVEQGFGFTAEEIKEAATALTDDELEEAAGGFPRRCFVIEYKEGEDVWCRQHGQS